MVGSIRLRGRAILSARGPCLLMIAGVADGADLEAFLEALTGEIPSNVGAP